MDKVAKLGPDQRRELFDETAARMNLLPGLVEKDFWVCWTLKHLFAIPEIADRILFKGGTTLSKVFGVIERFSEDIDLAVDYVPLGYTGERSPMSKMSKSKRTKLLDEMLGSCRSYIATAFTQNLRQHIEAMLGTGSGWQLSVDVTDPYVVNFDYPTTSAKVEYLRPAVRLELGTHAELV